MFIAQTRKIYILCLQHHTFSLSSAYIIRSKPFCYRNERAIRGKPAIFMSAIVIIVQT